MKYFRWWVIFLAMAAIVGMLASPPSRADGLQGLSYTTYIGGGGSPSVSNRTVISSGVTPTVNFDWGDGAVMNTGRGDGVIIHFTGYFKADTTGTYYLGTSSDDGSTLTVNGSVLVNCWCEQGPTFRYGAIDLTAGQVVPVDMWYYENGGGAVMQFYWYTASGWQIVPGANLATLSTFWVPPLGLGASSSAFNANSVNTAKVNNFTARTTNDSKVNIQQVGNFNTTTIEQSGTRNNYVEYSVSGSNNTATITQSGNSSTQANWTGVGITGNNNTVNITQTSTGGAKGAFVAVNNNSNTITVQQRDSGSHYAELNLSGGNKTVTVNQSGGANHMASITLSGNATGVDLAQQGSTQQFYSVVHNCATAGGCGTVTVRQGN